MVAAGRRAPQVRGSTGPSLAVTVHGPAGVVDLVVPAGAAPADVATAYAEQAGLGEPPVLRNRLGDPLTSAGSLAEAGVTSGAVLIASAPGPPAPPVVTGRRGERRDPHPASPPGALSVLWVCVGAGAAVLAGWCAARLADPADRQVAVVLLAAAAVLGVLPLGRQAAHRVVAAPAFGAAAAFASAWDPAPERLPAVVGLTALVAAVTAAVGRALDPRAEEALRVWVVAGISVFVVTVGSTLLGLAPQVAWALLLLGAMLAARFVPALAVDVPDQLLVDLERLAVTAWSARDRPPGRRGRTVVPPRAVAAVAARGARIVTAASAAILVVAGASAPLLLWTASLDLDRVGARVLVGLAGGSLLLAARSYRHVGARALLRASGLACWSALLVVVLRVAGPDARMTIAWGAIALACLVIVVAVATGRGWRSAWWARRAEVAEALCGSFAVASVFVAVGLFRTLWELTS
jgi:hypothetical protein